MRGPSFSDSDVYVKADLRGPESSPSFRVSIPTDALISGPFHLTYPRKR